MCGKTALAAFVSGTIGAAGGRLVLPIAIMFIVLLAVWTSDYTASFYKT